jgi:hypothetical protein
LVFVVVEGAEAGHVAREFVVGEQGCGVCWWSEGVEELAGV